MPSQWGRLFLKMENEIGSLEAGKRADIAILAEDPIDVGAEGLKDISVMAQWRAMCISIKGAG